MTSQRRLEHFNDYYTRLPFHKKVLFKSTRPYVFVLKFVRCGGFKRYGYSWIFSRTKYKTLRTKLHNRYKMLRDRRLYGSGFLSSKASIKYRLMRRDSRRCKMCGQKLPINILSIDHIIPVSKGGTNNPGNLQLLCLPCHTKKDSIKVYS